MDRMPRRLTPVEEVLRSDLSPAVADAAPRAAPRSVPAVNAPFDSRSPTRAASAALPARAQGA